VLITQKNNIYLLFSRDEAVAPNESKGQGPVREEEPGIFQVIERLEKITDALLSK